MDPTTEPDPPAERFRRAAAGFTARANAVPDDAWDNPAPCEEWVARDVVRHLVEWVPGFLGGAGIELTPGPSVDDDPAAAWAYLAGRVQALLDDPDGATREIDAGPLGRMPLHAALDMIATGDVLIHTWDLARATGLDETLDARLVSEMLAGLQPMDEMLRQGGMFGPKVEVANDADGQTKLIAFTGRTP